MCWVMPVGLKGLQGAFVAFEGLQGGCPFSLHGVPPPSQIPPAYQITLRQRRPDILLSCTLYSPGLVYDLPGGLYLFK